MNKAHAEAELYRAQAGYSGGYDGSRRKETPQDTPASVWSTLPSTSQWQGQTGQGQAGAENGFSDVNFMSSLDYSKLLASKETYTKYQGLYEDALSRGDTENAEKYRKLKNQAHADAENLRAKWGYSGGEKGNDYFELALPEDIIPQIALPSLEANPEMINEIYDKLNDATLSQLMASYNNSRAQTEHDMTKIPALYQQQRNAASADNEREKLAFREQAAASGLNAGNRSQANLAYSNQLQNSLGQLNTAEANALSEMQFSLTQLYNSYQQQIAAAVAENNYQRVAALYEDYTRAKESAVNTALNQAQLNMQVAEFNRQTWQNKVANQQQAWQNQFALASELAGYNSMGLLGALGSLSSDELNRIQRDYNVLQLGQYYPILRGYL